MSEGRSEDFQQHFCGTHFFNPPRYLRLLEIIPGPATDPEVLRFLMHFGDLHLGKTTVRCKDTPAFIANRIGVFGIMSVFRLLDRLLLSIDEVDALTGPLIGRPKSATFRTADVVGIDTLVKVAQGIYANCPNDEQRSIFQIPSWLEKMISNRQLGDKSKQGFFKKLPGPPGKEKEILVLNLKTGEYGPRSKPRFPRLDAVRQIDDLPSRLRALVQGSDQVAEFFRHFHYGLFSYISYRIPEIADEIFAVDDAMLAGFGWEIGAFESWDALGLEATVKGMRESGYSVAPWVDQMLASGNQRFYRIENSRKLAYSPQSGAYVPATSDQAGDAQAFLVMKHFEDQTVWKNSVCHLYHLGDGVLGLQWQTKVGSIGGEVLEGILRSIDLAESGYQGLVIANEGPNFSAGANVGMLFMLAVEQEFDELSMAVSQFQRTTMRARYSGVPVVIAPHGLTLGGACELSLHADQVIPAAESYIGLVESGVGLIPAGGGTKEFALRAAEEMHHDEPDTITLKNRFFTIATAKVSTSAAESFTLGYLRKGKDFVSINPARRIADAKQAVLEWQQDGYQMPAPGKKIKVLGRSALGALYAGINGMWRGNYATDHDVLVAKKLAYVICGGDLSEPSLVSEEYLLDLEREAFLSLCGEKKTLERIQSVLKTGKPIRN
jgi:3-hydroxyacyl-CoA dehydrogenase